MKALDKANLVIETFPHGRFRHNDGSERPNMVYLDCDFAARQKWLSDDEEALLRMLGAINIFAVEGGFMGEPLEYTDNLNTACAGVGVFKLFDDEENKEILPIPVIEVLELV